MLAIETAVEADRGDSILLKNLVPLNALSDDNLAQIVSRIRIEKVSAGQYLFREGDTDHQNVYLLEGMVALLTGNKEVDRVSSGSNIARFALAHQWPRKFSARALDPVRFVRIDSRQLSELLVRTQSQSYRVAELEGDDDDDWMSQVLRSRLFQQIPAASIQNVLRRMGEMGVRAGQVVVKEGDLGDYYYVIVRGEGRVTRTQDGQEMELARLGPGDSFGEDALVSGNPRGSKVTMLTDGVLVRLGKSHFVELIQRPLTQGLDYPTAKRRIDNGAGWIDIRPPSSYESGHLPGAINIPLDDLRPQSSALDPEREYLVYGDDRHRGEVGAFLLRVRGLDVFLLDGGLAAVPPEGLTQGDDLPSLGLVSAAGSDPLMVSSTPVLALEPVAVESPSQDPRPRVDTPEILRQSQERFQKALYQRIAELRQVRQILANTQQENSTLLEERDKLAQRVRSLEEEQASWLAEKGVLEKERNGLQTLVSKLREELDEVNEVLQEASAEESSHQWEKLRWDDRIKRLEAALLEQQQLNKVLRQENDETLGRLETLRTELTQKHKG